MNKLAVFITGPKRYTSLVIDNLARILEGIDYENFIFVWEDDLSNMQRSSEVFNQGSISSNPKTKVLLTHKPYTSEMIDDRFGNKVLGHSSKNAMIGMFYSINCLCSILKLSPDEGDFTHILRVRTDCLFYNNDWLNQYNDNEVLVADNPFNPSSWISDHFMLAPKEKFIEIWGFRSTKHINYRFMLAANNPEVLVSQRSIFYNKKKSLRRFLDYQIVYTDKKINDIGFSSEICENLESYFNLRIIPKLEVRTEFYDECCRVRYENERNILKKLLSHPYGESLKSLWRKK